MAVAIQAQLKDDDPELSRLANQRSIWALGIVATPPALNHNPRLLERVDDFAVEHSKVRCNNVPRRAVVYEFKQITKYLCGLSRPNPLSANLGASHGLAEPAQLGWTNPWRHNHGRLSRRSRLLAGAEILGRTAFLDPPHKSKPHSA